MQGLYFSLRETDLRLEGLSPLGSEQAEKIVHTRSSFASKLGRDRPARRDTHLELRRLESKFPREIEKLDLKEFVDIALVGNRNLTDLPRG